MWRETTQAIGQQHTSPCGSCAKILTRTRTARKLSVYEKRSALESPGRQTRPGMCEERSTSAATSNARLQPRLLRQNWRTPGYNRGCKGEVSKPLQNGRLQRPVAIGCNRGCSRLSEPPTRTLLIGLQPGSPPLHCQIGVRLLRVYFHARKTKDWLRRP